MNDMTRLRYLVEMQGYIGQTDEQIRDFAPWLKLAPAICATTVSVATVLGDPRVFAMLVPLAMLGAMLPFHPFDAFYQLIWAPKHDLAPIPESGAPRRFSCSVAAMWLMVTGAVLAHGNAALGAGLGWAFTATAFVPVFTDLCVPSFIWARVLKLPVGNGLRSRGLVEAS